MLGNWNRVRGRRIGIMLHYDDSTSDASGIGWLVRDERCKVSYTEAVQDDGTVVPIAPEDARAWHAGVCRSSDPRLVYADANSAFYGLAITANDRDHATPKQIASVVAECVRLFRKDGWPLTDRWRITTHALEAWPRLRKVDCEGQVKVNGVWQLRTTQRVLDYEEVRRQVAATT